MRNSYVKPEEQAKDFIKLFTLKGSEHLAVILALMCVDKIIKSKPSRKTKMLTMTGEVSVLRSDLVYWKKVKKVLEVSK
jgi:hypothetical protein